jgi:hypothetical protein
LLGTSGTQARVGLTIGLTARDERTHHPAK